MAKNYTKKQVLEAVSKSAGVMEYVAHALNCTWYTARKYVEKWEETKEAFQVSECKLHTLAYKSFHNAIKDGERWAIERVLDTSARRNGHGLVDHKQVDHTSSDGSMTSDKGTPEEYAEAVRKIAEEIMLKYKGKSEGTDPDDD